MKTTNTPVSIIITFESQKELDDFGTLCNCTFIGDVLKMPDCETLRELGADINNTSALKNKIKEHPALKNY